MDAEKIHDIMCCNAAQPSTNIINKYSRGHGILPARCAMLLIGLPNLLIRDIGKKAIDSYANEIR